MTYTPLRQPESLDSPIWHHFTIEYFQSLLKKSALHFATHAVLKEDERDEGKFPSDYLKSSLISERKRLEMPSPTEVEFQWYEDTIIRNGAAEMQHRYAISSWSVDDAASKTLFEAFGPVAIRSTTNRLLASLDEKPSYWGMVDYIDYGAGEREWQALYRALFHLKRFYQIEKELRLIVTLPGPAANGRFFNRVHLPTLIESVWISPDADQELRNEVEGLLDQKHLSDIPVH